MSISLVSHVKFVRGRVRGNNISRCSLLYSFILITEQLFWKDFPEDPSQSCRSSTTMPGKLRNANNIDIK